jgi:farnesyl-diphosphate farnesyltransferase
VADLDDLLLRTSRTFALSIPRLPEPLRREVTVAYLLFRIADTFEDAAGWPKARRLGALADFATLVEAVAEPPGNSLDDRLRSEATRLAAAWTAGDLPSEHEGYLDLLGATPVVLEAHAALEAVARATVARHTARTAAGMAGFVARHDGTGRLELTAIEDLRRYCYVVAGIVGELLTELFLAAEPRLEPAAEGLRERAARFGEALQLVNILKDAASDAREGRSYLPPELGREPVLALARRDLEAAVDYVRRLQEGGASPGLLAFTALPVDLAWRTLERVEREGPGAKLTRDEVAVLVAELERRLTAGEPAVAAFSAPRP